MVAKLEAKCSELNILQTRQASSLSEKQEAVAEKEAIAATLAAAKSSAASLSAENEYLKLQFSSLQSDYEKTVQRLSNETARLIEATTECKQVTSKLAEEQAAALSLADKLEKAEAQVAALHKEAQRMDRCIVELDGKCSQEQERAQLAEAQLIAGDLELKKVAAIQSQKICCLEDQLTESTEALKQAGAKLLSFNISGNRFFEIVGTVPIFFRVSPTLFVLI
jgi:chromosome segregation ATPase